METILLFIKSCEVYIMLSFLYNFTYPQFSLQISSPSLSKTQLNVLLQRCSEASDRTITEITSPRIDPSSTMQSQSNPTSPRTPSQASPRTQASITRAAPHDKLSDDTLQRLLSEAKESLGLLALENADSRASSSRASTALSPGRESSQLGLSLGDSPRSEMTLSKSDMDSSIFIKQAQCMANFLFFFLWYSCDTLLCMTILFILNKCF